MAAALVAAFQEAPRRAAACAWVESTLGPEVGLSASTEAVALEVLICRLRCPASSPTEAAAGTTLAQAWLLRQLFDENVIPTSK